MRRMSQIITHLSIQHMINFIQQMSVVHDGFEWQMSDLLRSAMFAAERKKMTMKGNGKLQVTYDELSNCIVANPTHASEQKPFCVTVGSIPLNVGEPEPSVTTENVS